MLALALFTAALPVLLVCTVNLRFYGWFGTCEFRAPAFNDAYGAMLRVRAGPELPYIPVTREARAAMAAVSPAFAELQRQFDAGLARGWAGASEFLTQIPATEEQIGGGWMMWALREAAAQAGHHHSARHALQFYRRLAEELNQACDKGRLPAGPARSGFMPPWREGQTGPFLHKSREFAEFVTHFRHFSARPPASSGTPEQLQLFRDLTRERISPPEGELDVVGAANYILNARKVEWLHTLGKALRPRPVRPLRRRPDTRRLPPAPGAVLRRGAQFPLLVAAAAWGACAASVLIHALIDVTSFPVLSVSSFTPIYPLLLVFIATAFWGCSAPGKPGLQPAERDPGGGAPIHATSAGPIAPAGTASLPGWRGSPAPAGSLAPAIWRAVLVRG
ncbi:MAG: hypothetical protein IPN11_07880 [Opitutaceae bacterium]|nr:hypothetical protein [Opitutaceae bacterium]